MKRSGLDEYLLYAAYPGYLIIVQRFRTNNMTVFSLPKPWIVY